MDTIDQLRMKQSRKKQDDKERKAAQFQFEYRMRYNKILECKKRILNTNWLNICLPDEHSGKKNSFSNIIFGKRYTAKQAQNVKLVTCTIG